MMHDRVLCKVSRETARLRRLLRKEAKSEVKELIESFTAVANSEDVIAEVDGLASSVDAAVDEDEQSDENFWASLPTMATQNRTHVREIPTQALRAYPGRMVKTRADLLKETAI